MIPSGRDTIHVNSVGLKNECVEAIIFLHTMSTDSVNKTSLESFLFSIRDKCRNKGAQMDENGNIYADLIYDDLLFLKELWMLVESGGVSIDTEAILRDTTITNIRLDTIASLSQGDSAHVSAVFNRLWSELQRSSLASIFDREFALKSILKDEKLKNQYIPILVAVLDYTGKVQLVEHEDTDPYEYFTKELKKGKSKYYGQFYTPEILTESCVNEIKPQFGEIGLDPAAGTGKFMRTASKYISKNQPEHSEWDAYQHMRMVEIENKIYRQGILGTFIKYKKLPNMANQRKGNSFDLLIKEKEQVDYILANPPYGGTVDGFDEIYYNVTSEQKGKRLVKTTTVKPEVVYPFEFVKKDTCVLFIQLCVNKLKDGGRAAVIFNATVMNDSHRDVIKWFLSKCNLYKMIVNPSGTFKCTGIETYSFIFTKGKPTEKIEYYDVVTGNKIGELTIAQIEQRGWDINPKFQKETVRNLDYQYVPINTLFILEKCSISASKAEAGDYPFITLQDYATHNTYAYDGENVFISTIPSGTGTTYTPKVRYSNGKVNASSLMNRLVPKTNDIQLMYFYYYWKYNSAVLKGLYHGTANKSLDKDAFNKYQIPLPPLSIQQEIVATLDRIFADPQDMKDCLAFTDKAMDLMLKDPSGKLLEDVMGGLRLKRAHLAAAAFIKAQMAAVMRSDGARGYEKKKLGDLCIVDFGERITQKNDKGTIYPVYGSGNDTFRTDRYNREGKTCKLGRFAISETNMVMIVEGKYWLMDSGFTIKSKDSKIVLDEFLWHTLLCDKERLSETSTGSCQKNIEMERFYNLSYSIPPLPIQEKVLAKLNEMEAELKVMEQMAANAEQRAKYILDGYLFSQPVADTVQEVLEPDVAPQNTLVSVSESEPAEAPTPPPKPAKKVIKLKKSPPVHDT